MSQSKGLDAISSRDLWVRDLPMLSQLGRPGIGLELASSHQGLG